MSNAVLVKGAWPVTREGVRVGNVCESLVPLLVCNLPHCGYYISSDWCICAYGCGWGIHQDWSRHSLQVGCIEKPGLHHPGKKAKGSSKYKGKNHIADS